MYQNLVLQINEFWISTNVLIEKNNNGVEGIDNFYALGGGGGGNGRISEYQSGPGNPGGSGGGRGGNIRFSNEDANQALSSQNLYNSSS